MRLVDALLVFGVVAEFAGIVLLGFPDFLPAPIRFSRWLSRQWQRTANLVRRLFRKPPRAVVVTAGASSALGIAMSASAHVSTSATTLEGQVEYLLRRDQDAQREANQFAARLNRLEEESAERLIEARKQMEEHVARELDAAEQEYRPLRIAGTVALAIGLGCVTAATFLA